MSPVIQFEHVSKKYLLGSGRPRSFQEVFVQHRQRGERQVFWALHDASFAIEAGERVALIGTNGSGKSTALKLISRVIDPTNGSITTQGRISGLLELGTGFHPDLTGRENIFLNGSILGISRREIQRQLEAILDFADIGPFIDVQVRNYSSGMVVRLGFAVTTLLQPDILLIDEVLAVGDQNFQRKCMDRLEELQAAGVTLLFVSHNMSQVQRLCHRVIWIDRGVLRADGETEAVIGVYLDAQEPLHQHRTPKFGVSGPQRWGTFQAEITKVELLDAGLEPVTVFKTGDQFRLRMHYSAHLRVEAPTFGLAFYRSDGVHINGPNCVSEGFEIPYIDGSGYVDYLIERLPLNEGIFELTVAIYDRNSTHAYDHHHRLYRFEVRMHGLWREEGIVHIPAQWEHSPLAEV